MGWITHRQSPARRVGSRSMKENIHGAKSEPVKSVVMESPVMETVAVLTPKAEAKAANKLPRAEQLNKFEKSLEAQDGGNQPA